MPVTNTSRSKKFLEKQGYIVSYTEKDRKAPRPGSHPCSVCHQQPQISWKVDAFGFGDLLAAHSSYGISLIQSCITGDQQKRVRKILDIAEAGIWLKSGGKIYVHGWKKLKKTQRWTVTVTAIELDKEFSGLRAREITLDDSPLFSSITTEEREEENDLDSMELQKPA